MIIRALYLLLLSSISSSRLYPVQSHCCFQHFILEMNWGKTLLVE